MYSMLALVEKVWGGDVIVEVKSLHGWEPKLNIAKVSMESPPGVVKTSLFYIDKSDDHTTCNPHSWVCFIQHGFIHILVKLQWHSMVGAIGTVAPGARLSG